MTSVGVKDFRVRKGTYCWESRSTALPKDGRCIKSMCSSQCLGQVRISARTHLFLDNTLFLEVVTQKVSVVPGIRVLKSFKESSCTRELLSQVGFPFSFQVPGSITLPSSHFAS